ncbi:hypothetical protein Poli38472_005923 [Pythium oligandrum]|uniref:Uncharacterized protein n=1 Tax=Pythium oligandrum TaxID=41045 RepID=A0A8K1CRZ5_PYTOL|nr:hypothetical protein Poli38472_005923 [Pythium oligandrum]|eukprot:TMW68455.1 hypothetical protein Poli38472_005923 [Pythium oligandrum]
MSDKYRWSEDLYDTIVRACVALTNLHIRKHKLREGDHTTYDDFILGLRGIGETRKRVWIEIQQRSRQKRAIRAQSDELGLPGQDQGIAGFRMDFNDYSDGESDQDDFEDDSIEESEGETEY